MIAFSHPTAADRTHTNRTAPPTVCKQIEVYIAEYMLDCRPASIADTRRKQARKLCEHCGGDDLPVSDLSDKLIAEFFAALRAKGKSAATINSSYRATLFAVWNHAFDRGLVAKPPRVRKLKEVRNPPCAWTVGEFRQILAAARMFNRGWHYGKSRDAKIRCDFFWEALLLVAYETAMRRGALLAIRQHDVNLETGWVIVDGGTTKTLEGQSYRLSTDTVDALRRIWNPVRKLVFAYATMHEINRHFGLILKAAGVPRRRKYMGKFHMIRRTSATLMCSKAGIAAASNLLGHSSSEVTRRNYIDPTQLQHDATQYLPSVKMG